MAELENWQPIRDTHAIQSSHLTVQFGQPVGDVLWKRSEASLAQQAAALGFDERNAVQSFLASMPIQIHFEGRHQVEQGYSYTRREDAAIAEQVTFDRDSIKYEQQIYTRWAPFRERAEKLMKVPVETYSGVSSLAAITSAYLDIFEFKGASAPDVSEVVDQASPYVASGSLQKASLWHTHSGFFEYPDAVTRRLIQVNVDVLTGPGQPGRAQQIRITTHVSDQFGQAESAALDAEQATWSFVIDHAEQQHQRLKGLLDAVLTKHAAQAISLGPL